MAQDHERIEELLAGYALLGLSGEDAIEADRLLSEHVPTCGMCRETLAGFRSLAGELGLVPSPAPAPEMLLPRIRRQLEDRPAPRRRVGPAFAIAAGVAALVGMAGLSMSLGTRADRAETRFDRMASLVDFISQPGAAPTGLEGRTAASPRMLEVSGPTLEQMVVAGQHVPQPAPGFVYVVWLGSDAGFRWTRAFRPDERGFVFVSFEVDMSSVDHVLITEERIGSRPAVPTTDGPHVWEARL